MYQLVQETSHCTAKLSADTSFMIVLYDMTVLLLLLQIEMFFRKIQFNAYFDGYKLRVTFGQACFYNGL